MTPGVTSPGFEDPVEAAQTAAALKFVSPHMKFIELNKRGYTVVDVNRDRLLSEWWHVPTIRERTNVQTLAATFATASGANHLVPAAPSPLVSAAAAELAPSDE